MKDALFLAWKNLNASRVRTIVLVACLTVAASLPIILHVVVKEFRSELIRRAEATPLIIGANGSRFDLTLHTLYLETDAPGEIPIVEADWIRESGFAKPIPVFARFRADGFRIVGTTQEYYELRGLGVATGAGLSRLGDCVVGAVAARELGLSPGDRLTSEPENLFDLTGSYPMKMRVVGILTESDSPDDSAVFVSLETAWIIAGHGHGHSNSSDQSHAPAEGEGGSFVEVAPFTEVTEDNVRSFHFHGDQSKLPLTAIIAVAHDEKSETLLLGRYLARDNVTVLEPTEIIAQLTRLVLRVERFLNIGAAILVGTTVLQTALIFVLSVRLRQAEIRTLFKLGSSHLFIARMMGCEIFLIILMSAVGVALVGTAGLSFGLPTLNSFFSGPR